MDSTAPHVILSPLSAKYRRTWFFSVSSSNSPLVPPVMVVKFESLSDASTLTAM